MESFQHPFQCLKYIKRQSDGQQDLLVATAGRYLFSYAASNGQRLDIWPQKVHESASTSDGRVPPEKRRKLSPDPEQKDGEKSQKDDNESSPAWSNIPILVVTQDNKHVVSVTAEDKCIRVFDFDDDGRFQELSSRCVTR